MTYKSANLKIKRAEKLISEVEELLQKSPPFTYVVETNTQTNERCTLAKKNDAAIDELVILCGDIFHNLRSALDHAYYESVSPFIQDDKKKKNIQFPFAKDSVSINDTIKLRQADKVNPDFVKVILSFKPYSGEDGNKLLSFIHDTNIIDKHKFPTPVANFKHINSDRLREKIPDFPKGVHLNIGAMAKRDIAWRSNTYNRFDLGEILPPSMCVFQKAIDLPVETWFSGEFNTYSGEALRSLREMLGLVKEILNEMYKSIKQVA